MDERCSAESMKLDARLSIEGTNYDVRCKGLMLDVPWDVGCTFTNTTYLDVQRTSEGTKQEIHVPRGT